MQPSQTIFLFSILCVAQFLISSQPCNSRRQSNTFALTADQDIQNRRPLALEISHEDIRATLQRFATIITQHAIVQTHSSRALQELRDDLNHLRASNTHQTTITETVILDHNALQDLRRRVQALENPRPINQQFAQLFAMTAQIENRLDRIEEHMQAMHESRQHLEQRLNYEFYMTEGRLWNLHRRVLALERRQ